MITFRFLHKTSLQEYVQAPSFADMPHLPITMHRGMSHWNNPKVTAAHPLLLLAEQDGELMGYLGVMPEWVYDQSPEPISCGWLTCMWVSGKARGQGLAGRLLVQMSEAYEGRVLLADYVPATIRVYEKTKAFTGPLSLSGFRGYLRFDLKTILPARYPKLKKFEGLFSIADRSLNLFFDRRFSKKRKSFNAEIVKELSASTKAFIQTHSKTTSFGRNAEDVHWMVTYPWVLEGSPDDPLNKRYQFSAIDRVFKNYAIEIKDESGELIGFLLCTIRNRHLKIPHAWFLPTQLASVAKTIEQYLVEWRVNTFTVFHPELVDHFRLHGKVFILKKSIYRNYLFSKGFAAAVDVDRLKFQDGDGDVGFT